MAAQNIQRIEPAGGRMNNISHGCSGVLDGLTCGLSQQQNNKANEFSTHNEACYLSGKREDLR